MEFSGQKTRVGSQFPSPGHLPNPGMETSSPSLQSDSLQSEPRAKPKNNGVGSLFLLQGIFPTQESNPRSPALQTDSLSAELPWKPSWSEAASPRPASK